MKVYYEEKYGGVYDVPDEIADNNEKLTDDLMEQFNIHNSCQGSTTVRLIGNGDPQYQIMGGLIDALDDKEKEFYLWYLLRFYYKRELFADKEKYKEDRATTEQIDRLLRNVEELDELLCYEIF